MTLQTFECNCPLGRTVICERHGVVKSSREVQICQGKNVKDEVREQWLKQWGEIPDSVETQPIVRSEKQLQPRQNYAFSALTPTDIPCEFRGDVIREAPCTVCGSRNKKTSIYKCDDPANSTGECTFVHKIHGMRSCQRCPIGQGAYERLMDTIAVKKETLRTSGRGGIKFSGKRGGPFNPSEEKPKFISRRQLADDILLLAQRIPSNTSRIIGVARSGVPVAAQVALYLHLPLTIFRQSTYDMIEAGNGWRLTGNTGGDGPPVVIDDTCMSGNSFKFVMPVVKKEFPDAVSACLYCNPAARVKPDMWIHDLPWPHFLEWNMFNSVMTDSLAIDFDGILCRDCYPGEDDDGERYLNFIRTATPLYPIRKTKVKLVVTARLEKYRKETEGWLKRNGIAVQQLVMAPYQTLRERQQHDMAKFKAKHYTQFLQQNHRVKPPCFVESDPHQARRIHELTRGIVICPGTGECHA